MFNLSLDLSAFAMSWNTLGTLVGLFALGYIVHKLFQVIFKFIVHRAIPILGTEKKGRLALFTNPLSKLVWILFVYLLLPIVALSDQQISFAHATLEIFFSIVCVWLGHQLVSLLSFYFQDKATQTDTKFDDILIPLITKGALVIVYSIGGVFILQSFDVNVAGVVAGLGIGGLAFAFAAKDSIANFFGSVMLILDRPFDIGDYIVVDGMEGTVESVGFRSTRIRTFYDSLITLANGDLMNRAIDNKGKRRYRRMITTLGLEYSTPPNKIEAFCEGIRQLILNHPFTRKDSFHVYFTNYGASSLDISMVVYWTTQDYAREQAEKHRLMIDILRLSKEIGVSFAFPTQTVHVFQGAAAEEEVTEEFQEKYLDQGIERAKKVAQKPLSLKNPRSNGEDQDQFGKNDIGL